MDKQASSDLPRRPYKDGVSLSVVGFGGIIVCSEDQVTGNRYVAEAVDRAGTVAAGKGVRIQVGPPSAAAVWGDHAQLVNAVRNLVDNAVTYSDPGQTVAVTVTPRPGEGLVDVAVVDQGIGIPAEAQSRLFARFVRLDPARQVAHVLAVGPR